MTKFDDLYIDDEFSFKGRTWKKKSQFGATCLDKDAPYEPGTIVAIERKSVVEPKKLDALDPNSIFRKRG